MCDRNDFKSYDGVRVVGTEKNGNESENSSRVDNSKIKKVWEIQNIIKSKACVFHSYWVVIIHYTRLSVKTTCEKLKNQWSSLCIKAGNFESK